MYVVFGSEVNISAVERMKENSHKRFGFIDTGGDFCIFIEFQGDE
jgi:hypothetical protein